MPENGKASVMEMIGEFLREAAVLVLVFVPLELNRPGHQIPARWYFGIVKFGLFLLLGGIFLERIRP
jgi:hypothetical protein